MKCFMVIIFLSLATGCQDLMHRDIESPFYRVPVAATLTLNRQITIAPHSVKVYFQNGRRVSAPDQYEPFCKFEMYPLKSTPQIVNPDSFLVYQTTWVRDIVAGLDSSRLYAAHGRLWWFNDDRPSPLIYATHLYLRSPAQPDVYRVVCGHLQDPVLGARHLSIVQIRAALGDVFTLRLPPQ